jgi:hypothetical protein
MLTKEKLTQWEYSYSKTTEQKIVLCLYNKHGGAVKLDMLCNEFPNIPRNTMTNVHIRKSPYLEYDRETGIVHLRRRGKDCELLSDNPQSVGQFIFSLLWKDQDISFEESCAHLKRWCNTNNRPIGDYCNSKSKHYSYYLKLVKKWKEVRE